MAELQKAPWSDWETVRLIGRGSFGTVYEIQRKLVDEDTESAALKVITIPQNPGDVEELYSEGYDDESITATFNSHLKSIVAEYSLMRKMDGSANIVNCKDIRYIQHDDGIGWDIFIRMELLTPLMKALPADTAEQTIIKIGKDICSALVLCKKHEIIHRDIKPQNIFVSPNGDYKLGDFGIAKTVEKTMGGTKIGTYKYMAPEVYNNQPYGSAADIYSLGLVLYWLLNERRMPFMPLPPAKPKAGQDEESRHRRLSGEKLPEPAHGSVALKQIVLKACAYDPKDRYSSAVEMLEDLNKLTGGASVTPPVIIPDVDDDEKREDDKTTGPVFDTAKKTTVDNVITDDSDGTVGPTFVVKQPQVKEPETETPKAVLESPAYLTPSKPEKQNKRNLLTILGVAAAALILLAAVLIRILGINQAACSHEWVDVEQNRFTLATIRLIKVPLNAQYVSSQVQSRQKADDLFTALTTSDGSEAFFAQLAEKHSEDSSRKNGGLYEYVYDGQFEDPVNRWVFDTEHRYGSLALIETSEAYVLVYFVSIGDYQISGENPQQCKICHQGNGDFIPFKAPEHTSPAAPQPTVSQSAETEPPVAITGLTVAVCLPDQGDWYKQYSDSIQSQSAVWNWSCEIFNAGQNVNTQIEQVRSIIAQNFDALIIMACDNTALAPVVAEAANAGIIVVDHYDFTNDQVETEKIYQVLFDQKEAGILQAETYIELAGETGKVAIIAGLTGADNAMQRTAGFEEVLKKYEGIEIVAVEYCDWDTQKAQTAAENILTAHPDLAAFLVQDDGMSKGVWNAIEAAGKQDTCKIASQGFYEWSKEYIKSDKFMFTITYPAGFFSRDAMDVIKAVVDGETVEHVKCLGMEVVTKMNVDTVEHD